MPSSAALLVTTWSTAALFGWSAVRADRPAMAVPAWVMALVGSVVASARLGVSRGDLHEPLFAAGVGLIAIGSAAYRLLPGRRAWSVTPLGLGLLVMPAALAFVIADQVHVVRFAGLAAAVYFALIWLIHTGAFAPLVAAMVAVGYAAALPESSSAFGHPLMWVPLAAVLLGVSAAQPRRDTGHWLAPVTPGLNVVWIGVLVLAGAISLDTGGLDRVLLAGAVLVSLSALRWRSAVVAYASLGLLAWAGAAAGTGWLALALSFDAIVVGVHATARADDLGERVLAPAASALGVGAIVSLGFWQQWSLRSALIAIAIVGVLTAALAVAFTVRRPVGRAAIWVLPAHAVAHGALVTYAAIGWEGLGDPGRYGPLAAALAAEAVLAGSSAATRHRVDVAWATAAFSAGAYVALGGWRAWSVSEALVAAAIPSLVLGGVALGIGFMADEHRLRLWEGPLHGLAQISALGFLNVGLGEGSIDPAAVFTGFLPFEAVTAGVIGTHLRLREAAWAATALGLASVVAAGEWADLDVWPAVWLAFSVGVLLAGVASVVAHAGEGTRTRLWSEATVTASQLAWAVTPLIGLEDLSPEAVSAVAALVLAVDAVFVASLARLLPASLRLREVSIAMASMASLLAVGAVDPDVASGLVILLAAGGALMLVGGSYRESVLGVWAEPVLVGGWVLTAG
ncbi:MAG: hypothetical protein R3190_15475, partial [Thermoanaerobaculia bacterium]|nr:hypothetical protein [Thermoanaerobaculia bacterium]